MWIMAKLGRGRPSMLRIISRAAVQHNPSIIVRSFVYLRLLL